MFPKLLKFDILLWYHTNRISPVLQHRKQEMYVFWKAMQGLWLTYITLIDIPDLVLCLKAWVIPCVDPLVAHRRGTQCSVGTRPQTPCLPSDPDTNTRWPPIHLMCWTINYFGLSCLPLKVNGLPGRICKAGSGLCAICYQRIASFVNVAFFLQALLSRKHYDCIQCENPTPFIISA